MEQSEKAIRRTAIHLLRSGKSPNEVAQELERSPAWVYKWRKRFFEQGWAGLQDQSRSPRHCPNKLPEDVSQAICDARSALEAEADEPGKLSYIGAHAVQARLRKKKIRPLPSISSIERVLRKAGLTRSRKQLEPQKVHYPHLNPTQPNQLVQVDIQPHYLPGGPCASCFNAIDVVSRYPTGQQFLKKRSQEAVSFLLQVWKELGIPKYTQVDNESCFSGGFTHPGVLGKVVRLALLVGTELVFSPFYHPESNGTIERFHQDYDANVWNKIELPDLQTVRLHSPVFFDAYRRSHHHSTLNGHCPADLHFAQPPKELPDPLQLSTRLPITAGKVHFIRRIDQDKKTRVLNLDWDVSRAQVDQGVWATLQISKHGATLRFFDAAPDAPKRTCLAAYPFPLKEPVQPSSESSAQHLSWANSIFGWISHTAHNRVLQWVSTML